MASTSVLVIFKLMQRGRAETRHVIMLSYAVSALSGIVIFSPPASTFITPWFLPAAVEGVAFYAVFLAMARTAQTNGIAVAGIASKMSVVIPVLIGLLFLGEVVNTLILAGILTGLIAIFLTAGNNVEIGHWKWPLFVFTGTGLIDSSFKLFQVFGLSEDQFVTFVTTVFGFAFLVGLFDHLVHKDRIPHVHSLIAGLFLGLVNFGTVYFILNALSTSSLESSVVYALNNIGIVGISTLIAVLLFHEKLNRRGWSGLALASISIILIYTGSV